ncbi:MAG: transporter [Ignavibacteria bacterium]|nr:transporter [Ignavibacteria bacterium]
MMKIIIRTIYFLIFYTTTVLGQIEHVPLVTDRPDQTESAVIVPYNTFQIETGFIYQIQKFSEDQIEFENENLILASTLIRYGITNELEFRFGGEYFNGKSTSSGLSRLTNGLQGFFVGSKYHLRKNEKILSDVSVILHLMLPFGHQNLKPDRIEPVLKLALSQEISEKFSLGINLGLVNNSSINVTEYYYSMAFGTSLTSKIGFFVEMYGSFHKTFLPVHNFDAGITYLHLSNLQIDFSLGTLLFKSEKDLFGGLGISFRIPK